MVPGAVAALLPRLPGWKAPRDLRLERTFRFADFRTALRFTDRVGALAEEQGHHPDLPLAWGKVRVEVWTHRIDGLTESDFVLAAKVERLYADAEGRK